MTKYQALQQELPAKCSTWLVTGVAVVHESRRWLGRARALVRIAGQCEPGGPVAIFVQARDQFAHAFVADAHVNTCAVEVIGHHEVR